MGAIEICRGAIFALQSVMMQCADSDAVLVSGWGELKHNVALCCR